MAALNIKRLPGEGEADFQRRYCREKMRIYRARKPRGPKRTRGPAKAPRADSTLTADEWKQLRRRPDETDVAYQKRYQREKMRLWRAKNRAHCQKKARELYHKDPQKQRERVRRYRDANLDAVREQQRKYFHANKEARIASLKAWKAANPDRYETIQRLWREENRAKCAAYSAAWRRACREQTPPWADLKAMMAFYEEAARLTAETGIVHHVDHIIPLRGKSVRGLHVQTNLRVIPAVENMRKHNRLLDELAAA